MGWCECPAGHDFACPPDTCRIHERYAETVLAADKFIDSLYEVVRAGAIVGALDLTNRTGTYLPFLSPGDESWLKSLDIQYRPEVSLEAVAKAHDEYLRVIDRNEDVLSQLSATDVLGVLPRLLMTPPESWSQALGLG